MANKVYSWKGDFDTISQCAARACSATDFQVEQNTTHAITFKNRGYDGVIKIKSHTFEVDISANGGNTASAVCFCIMFFLLGFGLLNAWYVLSRKPKNYIKKIVRRTTASLQAYSDTELFTDQIQRPPERPYHVEPESPSTIESPPLTDPPLQLVPPNESQSYTQPLQDDNPRTESPALIREPHEVVPEDVSNSYSQPSETPIRCNLCNDVGICESCQGKGMIKGERICEMCDGTGKCFCQD